MGDSVTVLDYGSRWMKAGWAYNFPTDEEPRVMAPSVVSVDQNGGGGLDFDFSKAEVQRPIRAGKIVDWEQFESLAYYILYDLMGWELGNEGNIMLCEPLLTGRTDREIMTQLMFEVFNVTGFFTQDQAVLSLFAVGRTNGLVVDVGHDKVDVGTVVEGMVNPTTIRRLEYGGQNLTQYLQRLMSNPASYAPSSGGATSAPSQQPPLTEEAAESLKELCIKVADSETAFTAATSPSPSSQTTSTAEIFKLPDGQQFTVTTQGLRVGEALFQPTALLGIPGANIAEAACDSAACILEPLLRKVMYENILVVGGGSLIPGLSQRLLSVVKSLLPMSTNAALCPLPEYIPSPSIPRDAAWVGGAVLAKVALQQNHFITKADYDEAGPIAVHRRCT